MVRIYGCSIRTVTVTVTDTDTDTDTGDESSIGLREPRLATVT